MAARGKRRRGLRPRAKEDEPGADNEVIESDESDVDAAPKKAAHVDSGSAASEEEDDEAETAEEKRLRLAKKYLADLGVEEDDEDDADELLATAKRGAGMAEERIAEDVKSSRVSISSRTRLLLFQEAKITKLMFGTWRQPNPL